MPTILMAAMTAPTLAVPAATAIMPASNVVAEVIAIAAIIGALLVVKHPTQPLAFLSDSGGTAANGHWVTPFLFAMILPAYLISAFDATGNASEETKDAAKKAKPIFTGDFKPGFEAFVNWAKEYGPAGIATHMLGLKARIA